MSPDSPCPAEPGHPHSPAGHHCTWGCSPGSLWPGPSPHFGQRHRVWGTASAKSRLEQLPRDEGTASQEGTGHPAHCPSCTDRHTTPLPGTGPPRTIPLGHSTQALTPAQPSAGPLMHFSLVNTSQPLHPLPRLSAPPHASPHPVSPSSSARGLLLPHCKASSREPLQTADTRVLRPARRHPEHRCWASPAWTHGSLEALAPHAP